MTCLLVLEVWPGLTLQICPRAVSDSASWLRPKPCQESASMSGGGTGHCVLGPRNVPKTVRYLLVLMDPKLVQNLP